MVYAGEKGAGRGAKVSCSTIGANIKHEGRTQDSAIKCL